MNLVSQGYDGSVAGSLANAAIGGPSARKASATGEALEFDPAASHPVSAPACRTRWRRLVDSLLSPISGPTLEGSRSRASHV